MPANAATAAQITQTNGRQWLVEVDGRTIGTIRRASHVEYDAYQKCPSGNDHANHVARSLTTAAAAAAIVSADGCAACRDNWYRETYGAGTNVR